MLVTNCSRVLVGFHDSILKYFKLKGIPVVISFRGTDLIIRSEDEDFYNKIDDADTVSIGIKSFSEKIMYNNDLFKKFVDLALRLNTSSAVRKMIIKKTAGDDWQEYRFNGLSDEVLINQLEDYLKYLFLFPSNNGPFYSNNNMASEVFEINNGKTIPLIKKTFFKGDNLIDSQIVNGKFNYFENKKKELKISQDKRLAYLKGVIKALLEDSIVLNKDILQVENSNLATIFDGKTVFELLEDSAYPDILLPKSPEDFSKSNENPHMHPMFFIKDFNEYYKNDKNIKNYINNRNGIAQKIIKNSKNFMKAARKGAIFKLGQDYLKNVPETTDAETAFVKNALFNDDLLIDTYEYPTDFSKINTKVEPLSSQDLLTANNNVTLPNVAVNMSDPNAQTQIDFIETYNKQKMKEFQDIRNMFGSKLGYKRRKDPSINPTSLNKNKLLEMEDYEPNTISKDSSKGITTLPSLRNAFPTFRLYLIEEDSIFSDRLTAYDDFFYYNSVISFSVENHRDLPAGTAKIQLQNLSGILDGTRKHDLKDVDIPNDVDEDALDLKNIYRNYADTIVLRHGINVQLRAGYDSNTNNLDILLSGRITDISYSNNNTICNIVVQSFGIELDTTIKGASSSQDQNNTFATTHHLLSHAIMSRELKHFGRRKVGRYFQTSEAMAPSLDIEEYRNSDYFNFHYTRSFMDTLSDNSTYLYLLLGFIPFSHVGRHMGIKVLNKFGSDSFKNGLIAGSKAVAKFGQSTLTVPVLGHVLRPGAKKSYQILFKNNYSISKMIDTKRLNLIINNGSNKGLVNKVALELQNKGFLSSLNNIQPFGGIGIAGAKYTAKAQTLIIRQYGLSDAIALGLIKPGWAGGAFNYGWKVLSADSLMIGLFKSMGAVGTIAAGLSFYGLLVDGLMAIKDYTSSSFETQQKDRFKLTDKLLLSPQDDNIFSPDPEQYMIKQNETNPVLKFLYDGWDATVMTFLGKNREDLLNKEFKSSGFLTEKRLNIEHDENIYNINGQTVWKIFKDMSYRHPGYVFGIRPYGNSMEYRMFFGLPNQRYFSKQITNNVIDRLNTIEEDLIKSNNNTLSNKTLQYLYPSYEKNEITEKKHVFSKLAIDEYLRKTKDRFTPYRQYHYITAENNIISNDIVISGHDLVNTVNVHYNVNAPKNRQGANLKTIEVSSLYKVTANNKKPIVLRDPNNNIQGITNAFRWGMGELLAKTKNLYQGSLLILGNTKINTNDVIILKDNITNMHGPLEVSYVIHSFDFQTGFITEVGISALVTGNESLTYPTYNAMIEYEARREIFEKFSSYRTFQSQNDIQTKNTIKDIVKEIIKEKNENSELRINIDDVLVRNITDNVFKTINNRKEGELPNFINDVIPEDADGITALTNGGMSRSTAETIMQTVSFIVGGTSLTSSVLIGKRFDTKMAQGLISNLGTGKASFYFGVGTLAVGLLTKFGILGDVIDSSYRTGDLGKNYFKKAIFSSMKGGNNIQLYPLVKDGMPLLAGGFEEISEKDIWENAYGNIYNGMSDAVSGRLMREQEYSEIGRKVLEISKNDDDWSIPTDILTTNNFEHILGQERTQKIIGWYLSENN